ncbi:glucose-6-phosphate dehydrogenase assembly protein OpcA [Corynebacterium lizhenjunii]|uniref:Glucose-6-phosphate dehydrogenase assembly protein OpcA n=1 Tax=Corynebacterium lizhenjunii TaxID=2709394 RepID=A0A7T0P8X5_9CORY|nr:glucose-6-phosphate dehydrogenase assembly protein OpcA [Corynebacterium lizhenjunii]QPK78178.1 glucose-6-phosphate dehydrogenase assembly protein OpcA [Corynebacterium lizhenjunii]
MIIPLPATSTGTIAKKLVEAQEHYTLTTGRVLTLIVVVEGHQDSAAAGTIDPIVDAVRDASHEHPSRVLVVVSGDRTAPTALDAELRVGGEAGASEIVIMHLHGALADQAKAVVTPLLLPDTPIVAWWPTHFPEAPSRHPVGALAQRRITNISALDASAETSYMRLQQLSRGYAPGDSDMTWASLTLWRGIVASALDRAPYEPVEAVEITGPAGHPAVEMAAAWLTDRLAVSVRRCPSATQEGTFPIHKLTFFRATSNITVEVTEEHAVRISVPGTPDSLVALNIRPTAEVLSEELRYLHADKTYAQALRALNRVSYA